MLFKPTPYLWSLEGLTLNELAEVADTLSHSSVPVRPIFECVKVYIKLDENSNVRYARHINDFLGLDKAAVVSRIKDPMVREAVEDALNYVEQTIKTYWPFRPGSSTWCLLEILDPKINIAGMENPRRIIIREATRIDIKGSFSKSPLLERMFSRMKVDITRDEDPVYVVDPIVYLRNISGTGVYTELKADLIGIAALEGGMELRVEELSKTSQSYLVEAVKRFSDGLFLGNSEFILSETVIHEEKQFYLESFPGINVELGARAFRLSGSFLRRKDKIVTKRRKAKKTSFPPLMAWRS